MNMSIDGMIPAKESWSTWRNTCPSATLSTTNLTWTVLRSKLWWGANNESLELWYGPFW